MMELLHNFLAKPKWEDSAVQRAKQMFLSHYKSLHKSLERETADRIMGAMFGPSRCFQKPFTTLLGSKLSAQPCSCMRVAFFAEYYK